MHIARLKFWTIVMSIGIVAATAISSFQALADDAPPTPKFKVGDTAPDFTLKDQSGKQVSLHDFRGKKNVVLAFYIFAFTGG